MSVRAKFKVTAITENAQEPELKNIYLSAVYGADSGSENYEYWKYTPSGQIVLSTVNLAASEQFEVQKEYYVDFSSVEQHEVVNKALGLEG